MADKVTEISLQVNSLLKTFFLQIQNGEEGVNVISDEVFKLIADANDSDMTVTILHLCGIIKGICDSLGLNIDEVEDYIINPISMNILKYG